MWAVPGGPAGSGQRQAYRATWRVTWESVIRYPRARSGTVNSGADIRNCARLGEHVRVPPGRE